MNDTIKQQVLTNLNSKLLDGEQPIQLADLDHPKVDKLVQKHLTNLEQSNKEGELTQRVLLALGRSVED